MEHFRVVVELGKKRSQSRVLYVRADNIIDAMIVGKKVRGGKPISVSPITYKEYMRGVHAKYDEPKPYRRR
jgi:hypothetical protein|tara:strand:- start:135 stop:347 length:213 start_codon:yes stop_codon:yes gene_type:complete